MFVQHQAFSPDLLTLIGAAEASVQRVAPLFPLHRAVAVNPFHGFRDDPIEVAAARLERAAGLRIFPARSSYRPRFERNEIGIADLMTARLEIAPDCALTDRDILAAIDREPEPVRAIPTVAELAAEATGTDWPGLVLERIGAWAQGHFDEGQALWPQDRTGGAWGAWREWAMRDLTPEILGLGGFPAMVMKTRQTHWRSLGDACVALGVSDATALSVFHRLLCDLGGWAGLGRYHLWEAEMSGARDTILAELLTIRLVWEQALLLRYEGEIRTEWEAALLRHGEPVGPRTDHIIDAVLLRAGEIASGRTLDDRVRKGAAIAGSDLPPEAQIVFCIDVRSERMRRAIEKVSPRIRTHGAAGFFGLPLSHATLASDNLEARCPALMRPASRSAEWSPNEAERRMDGRVVRAVGRFSRAAISSFAFVEAAGPLKLGPLIDASMTQDRRVIGYGRPPRLAVTPDRPEALDAAEAALTSMGLTRDFAPLVVFVGHEARVTNDAQAGLLQCGACGGHDGAVNARVLAQLLNETPIRRGLAGRGIAIPVRTVFMAGLHDTTGDTVTLFVTDPVGDRYRQPVGNLIRTFERAGEIVRTERAIQFPDAETPDALYQRGADWSQTRAEWGLAGCRWFVAAPRDVTRGLDLEGRAFLHDYDERRDPEGRQLAEILSGPVLVAAWINLQYYGAIVAPDAFGGGNKLFQNVAGGIGIIDGATGKLRGGPSDQGLAFGDRVAHEPLRLAVRVGASRSTLAAALEASPAIRGLSAAGWIDVGVIGAAGCSAHPERDVPEGMIA